MLYDGGATSLVQVEPSKPDEPQVGPPGSNPGSRPGSDEALVGEIIPKGVPLGGPPPGPQSMPAPPPVKKGRIGRTVLVVLASVAAFLCLGGLLTGYLLYDKATTPDRTTPTGTLEQYLNAKFATRDVARVRLFQCDSSDLATIDQLLTQLEGVERRFGVRATVTSSDLVVTVDKDNAKIRANLNIVIPEENGQDSRSTQIWDFFLAHDDSWRICRAQRIS